MLGIFIKVYYTSIPKRFTSVTNSLRCMSVTKIESNTQLYTKVGNFPNALWEHTLPSTIQSGEIKTAFEWNQVRNILLQSRNEITPISVDSIILTFCIKMKYCSLAYSYLEFLKSTNVKLNLAVLGKYFNLFYIANMEKTVDKKEEEDIFNMYKDIRKTYSVLDPTTCDNIIPALSLTKYWHEAFILLNEIKVIHPPTTLAYSMVAAAAFKNNDHDLGWHLLDEIIDHNRTPFDVVYIAYLENCKTQSSRNEVIKNLEKLFQFFRFHNIECSSESASKLIQTCKELNFSADTTTVTNRGICLCCEQKLQNLTLTEQDFAKLKQAIFENVIIGKNVFYKTTPDELQRFSVFLNNMKKYDVVIDGLNVAYSAGVKQSSNTFSRFVIATVRYFTDKQKKVLVLGRKHMNNWPNWKQVTTIADTFLTQSLSQDDPYLLYCALNCGLNTIIVSRDLMRSHLFKLKDPHLKVMFSQWLNQSQLQVRHISNQGKVFINFPPEYLRTAQSHNDHWHIPYNDSNEQKWICLCK